MVLRNYGAIETENSLTEPTTTGTRSLLRVSQSMTFAAQRNDENLSVLENGRDRAIPQRRRGLPLRSLSIGGLSAWSN